MSTLPIPFRLRAQAAPAGAACHGGPQADTQGLPLVAIVGSPNVGKSVLFNALTGAYVTVSNYPGTTVEVSRGKGRVGGVPVGVVDTPGMYRLLPITEEERVARQILLRERPAAVLHVVDAKNLERMLPMTLQLIEANLPVVLVLNLMDEAERLGIEINAAALQQALGIPVVKTAVALGRGVDDLRGALRPYLQPGCACSRPAGALPALHYPPAVEGALAQIEPLLSGTYPMGRRAMALLVMQRDPEAVALVGEQDGPSAEQILRLAATTQGGSQPLPFVIARAQRERAALLLEPVMHAPAQRPATWASRLGEWTINPWTGIPLLLLALLLLYEFVGVLGAQVLVKFLEEGIFGAYVNPWVDRALAAVIPWPVIRDLFGGPFGMITLGLRYAVAIILPIVGTFFLAFSVIEDSGYLPRLAMLVDRVFKRIGLNGRAVIPLVLGFGCDTMATIVTRTLETRRERLLATILLSLAIPCSAQLGVMLALLGGRPDLLGVWALMVGGVLLLVGWLSARLVPGEAPTFYMELPPLRVPTLRNILVKTYTRMEWYFREVMPLFIAASLIIWAGRLTGLFELAVSALQPPVVWLGLPKETAVAFLFGFFRRDYGAAGLYDMAAQMNGAQLLVATVTMTLFVPCIAQFSVTIKERGWKTAVAIAAFIFPFAFAVGAALHGLLTVLGVGA